LQGKRHLFWLWHDPYCDCQFSREVGTTKHTNYTKQYGNDPTAGACRVHFLIFVYFVLLCLKVFAACENFGGVPLNRRDAKNTEEKLQPRMNANTRESENLIPIRVYSRLFAVKVPSRFSLGFYVSGLKCSHDGRWQHEKYAQLASKVKRLHCRGASRFSFSALQSSKLRSRREEFPCAIGGRP